MRRARPSTMVSAHSVLRHAAIGVLAFLASSTTLSAQDTLPRVDVTGMVVDGTTGESLGGAAITIEDAWIRALTDEEGRFVLRGIPATEQTWVIERLGYATWRQPLAPRHLEILTIALLPRPVALEEIRVKVDRLAERRAAAPYSVRTVPAEEIRAVHAGSAADLVRSMSPWLVVSCPADSDPGSVPGVNAPDESSLVDPGPRPWSPTELCILYRGRAVQPTVCVDERPVPFVFAFAYSAAELYAVDFIQRFPPEVRFYTKRFLESGRRLMPLTFPCR